MIDITGQIFNRLTALKIVGRDSRRNTLWECICKCGNVKVTTLSRLRNKTCQSCGCIHTENKIGRAITHGLSRTPEYNIWRGVLKRCNNANTQSYHRYGGRGIKVCPEWLDFKTFYTDMGPRPSDKHSIERKDNNKGYNKNNCIWATQDIQANNTRTNVNVTFKKTTRTVAQWAKILNIKYSTLLLRIKSSSFTTEEALFGFIKNNAQTLLTYKGKTQNINSWTKELGLSQTLISGRLRMGWSVDKTLSTTVKTNKLKKGIRRVKNGNFEVRKQVNGKRIRLYYGPSYSDACESLK